jgi:hypothetical protein
MVCVTLSACNFMWTFQQCRLLHQSVFLFTEWRVKGSILVQSTASERVFYIEKAASERVLTCRALHQRVYYNTAYVRGSIFIPTIAKESVFSNRPLRHLILIEQNAILYQGAYFHTEHCIRGFCPLQSTASEGVLSY